MAATKKSDAQTAAERAAEAYHVALTDRSVDDLIGVLAVEVGQWQRAVQTREAEGVKLLAAEQAAEASVVAAYEAAKEAGAKVNALAKIGLKPDAAIAALKKREKPVLADTGSAHPTDGASAAQAPVSSPDPARQPQATAH